MANIAVPDHTGTQNYGGCDTGNAYFSMPISLRGPMPTPNLQVVANGYVTPQQLPDQMIQVTEQGAQYTDLFTTLTPEGIPAKGYYPGTFALTTGAMLKA